MNSLSHLYVAAHINDMLNLAANERLAAAATKGTTEGTSRLAAAAKGAWSLLTGPAERPMTLPALTNYPYRG